MFVNLSIIAADLALFLAVFISNLQSAGLQVTPASKIELT